ncbi:MAG: SAM-dependent methyltransferase, partial [Acetobacteraceae bacterium]|nr:SAM-dependent methyltransferase [Acetobacteraceae bacterium]
RARIELDATRFGPDALLGLDAFSHAEIVFLFDRLPEDQVATGARRPRGNPDWPLVGIFAQRGRNRPNRLGVSVCRILGVAGTTLHVEGLDAIDGTPVLDIKPVMSGFQPRGTIREPDWARAIMRDYW